MKRIISVLLALALCLSLSVPVFAAEDNDLANGFIIKKTDIKTDLVTNEEGYGGLQISAQYDDDWMLTTYPQVALIDRDGNILIDFKNTWHYYSIYDGIVSLVSRTNEYPVFMEKDEMDEWVYVEDPIGFYSIDGEELFSQSYFAASAIKDGYAYAIELGDNDFYAYLIDSSGNVVLELGDSFGEYLDSYSNGYSQYLLFYDNAGGFSEGLLACSSFATKEQYLSGSVETLYYLDTQGNKVITLSGEDYSLCYPFNEGLACVRDAKTEKYGYINREGELVIPCEYDTHGSCNNGLINVSKDGKYGYINIDNEVVIPLEYDEVYSAGDGLMTVNADGKYGLIDRGNNVVLPFEYDDLSVYTNGVAYAVKDGYVYILTPAGELLLGDADGDGSLTIVDATAIQRHLAELTTSSYAEKAADADEDGAVTIVDATAIQRNLASLPTHEGIGTKIF